jgi:peptide subunit release factor 1 (eRF1)
MFSDGSEQFFWFHDLRVHMHDQARWDERPYVRPLLEALDEHERYGVVLTEHGRSRLFSVFMGDIEEHVDAFTSAEVRHLTSTGTDHLRSQMQFQRKSEIHALWHLKHAAELLDHLVAQYAFDRLVLAGPEEPVTELARLLPKRLRARVVARIHLPFSASADQVLKATQDVVERAEREAERRLVEELLEDAGAHRRAVTGLDATLLAMQEGRVYRLIYVEGFRKAGWRCDRCHALCAETCQVCPYCGGSLSPIEDLIDTLARQVVDSGGKVEVVSGEAARILSSAGSIGAQLRY